MGITINTEIELDIEIDGYKKGIENIVNKEGKDVGEIEYVIVNRNTILRLNKEYLNHDYYTDIITFDNSYFNKLEGTIFICWDIVKENAKEFSGNNFIREIKRVFIHGILHMLCYNDISESEKIVMRKKEDEYIHYLD